MEVFGRLATAVALLLVAGCETLSLGWLAEEPEAAEAPAGPPRPWIGEGAAAAQSFEVIGHRGVRGYFPENTLPSFRSALRLGVTTLEMDAGMTKDGIVVVHHDRRLSADRTRGPDGAWIAAPGPALVDLTFEELSRFDVGTARPGGRTLQRFPDQRAFDGVGVPALTTVLLSAEQLSDGRARYSVETKLSPIATEESPQPQPFVEAVVAALRQAGVAKRSSIQSFDWRTLQHVQKIAPEIETVYLTAQQPWLDMVQRGKGGPSPWTAGFDIDDVGGSVPALVKAAGGDVWSPYFLEVTKAEVEEAHRHGMRVVVWTVNDALDLDRMLEFGVDGIVTDYPDRLQAIIEARGATLIKTSPPATGSTPPG